MSSPDFPETGKISLVEGGFWLNFAPRLPLHAIPIAGVDCVMIDWISAVIPVTHRSVNGGHHITVDADGVIEKDVIRSTSVAGSFDSSLRIRTHGDLDERGYGTHIAIAGNPAKWLLGHNVLSWYGDMVPLILDTIARLDQIGVTASTQSDLISIAAGDFRLSRVDLNRSYAMASAKASADWIYAASVSANMRYRGAGGLVDNTLYFGRKQGKRSDKASFLRIYAKGRELREADKSRKSLNPHRLPTDLPARNDLLLIADKLLRVELQISSNDLRKMGLCSGKAWRNMEKANTFFQATVDKLEFSTMNASKRTDKRKLSATYRATYDDWLDGVNVGSELNPATFKRHRKAIRDALGLDIALRRPPAHLGVASVADAPPLRDTLCGDFDVALRERITRLAVQHPELFKPQTPERATGLRAEHINGGTLARTKWA